MAQKPHYEDTCSSSKVCELLGGGLTPQVLQGLDRRNILRPSHYARRGTVKSLITREERDALVSSGGTTGDPERRYTYQDRAWLELLISIESLLDVTRARAIAAGVVKELRSRATEVPPAARLVFCHGRDVYLLLDDEQAECLTRPGEVAMARLLIDRLDANVLYRTTVSPLDSRESDRSIQALGLALSS